MPFVTARVFVPEECFGSRANCKYVSANLDCCLLFSEPIETKWGTFMEYGIPCIRCVEARKEKHESGT